MKTHQDTGADVRAKISCPEFKKYWKVTQTLTQTLRHTVRQTEGSPRSASAAFKPTNSTIST